MKKILLVSLLLLLVLWFPAISLAGTIEKSEKIIVQPMHKVRVGLTSETLLTKITVVWKTAGEDYPIRVYIADPEGIKYIEKVEYSGYIEFVAGEKNTYGIWFENDMNVPVYVNYAYTIEEDGDGEILFFVAVLVLAIGILAVAILAKDVW